MSFMPNQGALAFEVDQKRQSDFPSGPHPVSRSKPSSKEANSPDRAAVD